MAIDGPHHIVTDSETGKSEARRLLSYDELKFSVRMAIMQSSVLSGTLRKDRRDRTAMIEAAVADHLRLCGYQVFSRIPQPEPASSRRHSWDDGGGDPVDR